MKRRKTLGKVTKKPGYKEAVVWIALNDDNEWLDDDEPILSVTASLVRDMFGVTETKLLGDLRRTISQAKDFLA